MININKYRDKISLSTAILFLAAASLSLSITLTQGLLIISLVWLVIYLYKNDIDIAVDCPYFMPFFIYWVTTQLGFFTGSDYATLDGSVYFVWVLLYLFVGYYLVSNNAIRYILMGFIVGAAILAVSVISEVLFTTSLRGSGFLSIYMTSGNVLAMAATMITAILILKYERRNINILYSILLLLIVVGIFYTGTRGALLSFFISISAMLILKFRLKGVIMVSGLFVILLIGTFITDIGDRLLLMFTGSGDYKTSHGWRFLLWENSFKLFKEYMLFGIGSGAYEKMMIEIMPTYYLPKGHAHNGFIHQLTLFGIVGFVAFLSFYAKIVYTFITNLLSNKYAFIGFFVSITYFLEGMTENNFTDSEVAMFHAFFVGIMLAAVDRKYKEI